MAPKIPSIPPFLQSIIQQLGPELRGLAEESGTDCDAPGCDALTIGTRCVKCSRRVCVGHTFWNFPGAAKPRSFCPYCVLLSNPNLFADDEAFETYEADVKKTARSSKSAREARGDADDVVDAEFTRDDARGGRR